VCARLTRTWDSLSPPRLPPTFGDHGSYRVVLTPRLPLRAMSPARPPTLAGGTPNYRISSVKKLLFECFGSLVTPRNH